MLIPVILAGGLGSRLWPLSRQDYPKHLLTLLGEQSLLQSTLLRAAQLPEVSRILLVCNQQHQDLIRQQLAELIARTPQLNKINYEFIVEPIGRSTAPAITLAALHATETSNNAATQLLVLPSDHVINPQQQFVEQINLAYHALAQNDLLTFGITPQYAETGYGYIKTNRAANHQEIMKIEQFIEKPNIEKAQHYCEQKEYYWNSGMFLFHANTLLNQVKQHAPDLLKICQQAWANKTISEKCITVPKAIYQQCPNQSIDYAVMEKTHQAMTMPLKANWYDIGTWNGLLEATPKDSSGSVITGNVITEDVKNSYIQANSRLVVALGLEDCIVVETDNALLIAKKSETPKLKKIVEQLNANKLKSNKDVTIP